MNVTVIGAGYVGLVSAACLAESGHTVLCVDNDKSKLHQLQDGKLPVFEPGLSELVTRNIAAGRLSFAESLVAPADIALIAVGTPSLPNGRADVSQVLAAAEALAALPECAPIVAIKSTVPVGTGDAVARIFSNVDGNVAVVSNPEFLREGKAVMDFQHPDRIVVGLEDERAREVMTKLYWPLHGDKTPIVFTGRRTAELIKHAANAFLAMKISFINEMADLCEAAGGNIDDLALGIGLDPRIGRQHLRAGPGYGGSCLPKDTRALATLALDCGTRLQLVETTIEINDARKAAMAERIISALGGDVRGKRIGVLGLTFTPGSDDVRESPAIDIIGTLLKSGAVVCAYDPQGTDAMKRIHPEIDYVPTAYGAANGADAIAVITDWDEFRTLDLTRLKQKMVGSTLFDFRNIFSRKATEAAGLTYHGIGRGSDPRAT